MTITTRVRTLGVALITMALFAGCSDGYFIDAGKTSDGGGGKAFIGFVLMVVIFTAGLFYMDRIRQKREDRNEPQ